MKTIEIEKHLELNDAIELLPLVMKDRFIYKKEEDGIRCMGPFFIKGRYTTSHEVKDFQDVFEFDIFAGKEKLDGTTFRLHYEGYDYAIQNGVTLYLHFSVQGVKEEACADSQVEVVKTLDGKEEKVPTDTFHLPTHEDQSFTHSLNMGREGVGTNYKQDQIYYRKEEHVPNIQMEGVSSSYLDKLESTPIMMQNVSNPTSIPEPVMKQVEPILSNAGKEGVGSGSEMMLDNENEHRELFEIPRFKNEAKEDPLPLAQEEPPISEPITPILTPLKEEDIQVEQVMTSTTIPEPKEAESNLKAMEELFDTKDSVAASYSFVVVKRGDTYSSIAQRYHVDEEKLKQANANKEIHERSLLVLPYLKP